MITAVIGHGRSPEGKGWGGRIDACGRVVRMWNWHWQQPADYGTRFDWGLIEVHKSTIRDWLQHNQHQPAEGWVASLLQRYRHMVDDLPPGLRLIDQKRWTNQARRDERGMGETGDWQLTRGGIAACFAIDLAKAGDTVALVGFDVIEGGISLPVVDAFSPEYMSSAGFFGMGAYKPGKTVEGNHDYPAERKLIEAVAARACVSIEFWK